jgi:hypothetical protein
VTRKHLGREPEDWREWETEEISNRGGLEGRGITTLLRGESLQGVLPTMRTKEEILQRIKEIEADERYSYPSASTDENVTLALIQVDMEATVRALKWVLE